VGLHIKRALFLSDFNQNWNILTNSVKVPSTKFQENPSDGNHTVLCGQTDGHDEAPLCKPTSQTTQNQL